MRPSLLLSCILSILTIHSCTSEATSAAASVESYYQALAQRDYDRYINYTCAIWEAQARSEFDSFTAVNIELGDLKCEETDKQGDFNLVKCNGKIIANYGNEILEIDLSTQTIRVVYEGGEWRVCGYQ